MSFLTPTNAAETAEVLQQQFLNYLNDEYDQQLSEVFANAVNEFLEPGYGSGTLDPEIENEIAVRLVMNLRVVNVSN